MNGLDLKTEYADFISFLLAIKLLFFFIFSVSIDPYGLVFVMQIERVRFNVQQPHELATRRAISGPSAKVDLDIPESVGVPLPQPAAMLSSKLREIDSVRRGKMKM